VGFDPIANQDGFLVILHSSEPFAHNSKVYSLKVVVLQVCESDFSFDSSVIGSSRDCPTHFRISFARLVDRRYRVAVQAAGVFPVEL
jgi:hypothetical protein